MKSLSGSERGGVAENQKCENARRCKPKRWNAQRGRVAQATHKSQEQNTTPSQQQPTEILPVLFSSMTDQSVRVVILLVVRSPLPLAVHPSPAVLGRSQSSHAHRRRLPRCSEHPRHSCRRPDRVQFHELQSRCKTHSPAGEKVQPKSPLGP